MKLFDKLFQKKHCSICDSEIKLFGKRKLADGNLCKSCEAKLSPFFSNRRNSTVAQIREQLAYREENKKAVAVFHPTLILGERTRLVIDEDAKKFLVTGAENPLAGNPDILSFSQITGCMLNVEENQKEEKKLNEESKYESYDPPRYHYSYQFHLTIHVVHPYFSKIHIPLNHLSVKTTTGTGVIATEKPDPEKNPIYKQYEKMGQEMKQYLLQARQDLRLASAPQQAVTCPWCGATTIPDASGCCEYCCGSVRN